MASTERRHGDFESRSGLAEEVAFGHDAVLEDEVAGGRAADAELVLFLAERQAGGRLGHDERRDALVL